MEIAGGGAERGARNEERKPMSGRSAAALPFPQKLAGLVPPSWDSSRKERRKEI